MGRPRKKLTAEQRSDALAARKLNVSWETIAKGMAVSVVCLRSHLDPEFRTTRNAYQAKYRRATEPRGRTHHLVETGPPVPPRPRYAAHTDMTAILMGNPAFERSALGQKRAQP